MICVDWLIDRLGTRVGCAVAMIFWSLASTAHAVASSFTTFIVAWSALGFGESGVSIAFQLNGKNSLVTGSRRGLGAAITVALAEVAQTQDVTGGFEPGSFVRSNSLARTQDVLLRR
jgi:MFS family permease